MLSLPSLGNGGIKNMILLKEEDYVKGIFDTILDSVHIYWYS